MSDRELMTVRVRVRRPGAEMRFVTLEVRSLLRWPVAAHIAYGELLLTVQTTAERVGGAGGMVIDCVPVQTAEYPTHDDVWGALLALKFTEVQP